MCDISGFTNLILLGEASMLAAIAFLAAAMIANAGFFSAPASPALMLATAASAAAAAASFTGAWLIVEDYFICNGSPEECLGDLRNLQGALVALTTLLTVQAGAAAATALVSAVPWVGQTAMVIIAVALASTSAMVLALQEAYSEFLECMNSVSENFWVMVLAIIITLGAASLIFFRKNEDDLVNDDNNEENDG
ncbi:MAG: hypothetical protein ACFHVJ_15875 [Aestuariibacter sp.]